MGRNRVPLEDKRVIMNVTVHPTTYALVEKLAEIKHKHNLSQAVEAVILQHFNNGKI